MRPRRRRLTEVATRRHVAGSAAALLALAALAGCDPSGGGSDGPRTDAPGTAPPAIEVVDAGGRTVQLPAPARRIVSLVPSVNQILLELGAGDALVGRTDYDTVPALRGLPSVGGGLGPDLETLAALRPDLVVRFAGDSDTATPTWLDELGVAHLAVRPDRIADVFDIVAWMGRVTGRVAPAGALRDRLSRELEAVAAATAPFAPVRTAYLMGGTPPWTAGGGTFIDELITLAGGVNVFADLDRLYAPVSPEVVASRDVDVFLVSRDAEVDPRVVGDRTVRTLSPDVQLPGPRLGEAAREVARALHPELRLGGAR